MDSHVNDRLARGHARTVHRPGFSGGHNQNLRPAALFRQVFRVGVAGGDGGVSGQQQHGRGLSDDKAAPHHRHPLSVQIAAVVIQKLHAGLCGARGIARALSGEYPGKGSAGDAVHILFGKQGFTGRLLVQRFGQGAQHQKAVDVRSPVDALDGLHQLRLRAVGG
ncbi:hypothetical protein SDC9_126950 [bioreactor metagenome]|uniref:Uncharacterized protein n=1 Tax=bioreactor metagenome TaxID=1076179 RepID=A0A645CSK5_9ZZZZ